MNWVVTIFYFILFLLIIKRLRFFVIDGITFKWIALAFTVKVIAGILYGYLDAYIIHGGDSMNYFMDANWFYTAFKEDPIVYLKMLFNIGDDSPEIFNTYYLYLINWHSHDFDYFFNEGRTLIRFHGFVRLFSFGYYNVHVIVCAFLSLAGLTMLYKTFSRIIKTNKKFLFAALFFLPSIVLWSSAVLKEPVLFLGIGLFVYHLHELSEKGLHIKHLCGLIAGILILFLIRFHVLLSLLPGAIIFIWYSRTLTGLFSKSLIVYGSILILAFSFHYIVPGYNVSHILYGKLMNFVKNEAAQNPGKEITYTAIDPTFSDILIHSPLAFLKTLAAPTNEILSNKFRLAYFIENMALLMLVIFIVLNLKKQIDPSQYSFLFFCISFIIMQYTLIGLTVPFEGTIVRLRSIALPFLLFILLSFADLKKMRLLFSKT